MKRIFGFCIQPNKHDPYVEQRRTVQGKINALDAELKNRLSSSASVHVPSLVETRLECSTLRQKLQDLNSQLVQGTEQLWISINDNALANLEQHINTWEALSKECSDTMHIYLAATVKCHELEEKNKQEAQRYASETEALQQQRHELVALLHTLG